MLNLDVDSRRVSMNSPEGIAEYEIIQLLGEGNYTKVVLVREGDKELAIKMIDRRQCQIHKKELDVLMEKHVLLRLKKELYLRHYENTSRHFPFPLIRRTSMDSMNLYIVQDAIKGFECWSLFSGYGVLYPTLQRSLIAQIVMALKNLHECQIVHRDLKLENVIISHRDDNQRVLKHINLIDFGTSLDLSKPDMKGAGNTCRGKNGKKFHHWVGTPNFMPPEAIHNRHSDLRNDLWSLGCTIYQILAGEPPHKAPSEYLTFLKAENGLIDMCPDMDSEAVDLIMKLVVHEPKNRLGALSENEIDYTAIQSHSFFKGINWEEVQEENYEHPPSPLSNYLCKRIGDRSIGVLKGSGKEGDGNMEWDGDFTKDIAGDFVADPISIQKILLTYVRDDRYKTECLSCGCNHSCGKQAYTYQVKSCEEDMEHHTEEIVKQMISMSCDPCRKIMSTFKVFDQLEQINVYIRRALHNQYREWRDNSRDDGFFVALSDKFLERGNANEEAKEANSQEPLGALDSPENI